MNYTSKSLLFSGILFLYACGSDEEESIETEDGLDQSVVVIDHSIILEEINSVSKSNDNPSENETVTLTSRLSRHRNVIVNLYRSIIIAENIVTSEFNNEPSLNIEIVWDEVNYIQSSDHNTHTSVEIISLDFQNVVAYINISGQLVNPENGAMFVIEESTVEVGGLNFYALTDTGPDF